MCHFQVCWVRIQLFLVSNPWIIWYPIILMLCRQKRLTNSDPGKKHQMYNFIWKFNLTFKGIINECVCSCLGTLWLWTVQLTQGGCLSRPVPWMGSTMPFTWLTKEIVVPCLIVALYKAAGNVSLDCTCFLLPCIFIKTPRCCSWGPAALQCEERLQGQTYVTHFFPSNKVGSF